MLFGTVAVFVPGNIMDGCAFCVVKQQMCHSCLQAKKPVGLLSAVDVQMWPADSSDSESFKHNYTSWKVRKINETPSLTEQSLVFILICFNNQTAD